LAPEFYAGYASAVGLKAKKNPPQKGVG
jgi:hypothetical protein